jgi:plasmid stability protein
MKNVTIALDDETHRNARIRAAELGTSLSALVKHYLEGLSDGPAATTLSATTQGVREMQMSFAAEPAAPLNAGPPWLVDGKWVYTKDGKPRKPGALKHMWVADDFDEWPDGFIDAMLGVDTPASDEWWRSANDVLKSPKAK